MSFAFFISLCIGAVSGLIEPIPLPNSLEECINFKVDLNKGSGVPLHVIQNLCLGKFIAFETPHSWARNLTDEEQNYMKSLHRKIISESEVSNSHRVRRATLFPKRIRREIRAAPFKHWEDYKQAVRRLKFQEVNITYFRNSNPPRVLSLRRLYSIIFSGFCVVPPGEAQLSNNQ